MGYCTNTAELTESEMKVTCKKTYRAYPFLVRADHHALPSPWFNTPDDDSVSLICWCCLGGGNALLVSSRLEGCREVDRSCIRLSAYWFRDLPQSRVNKTSLKFCMKFCMKSRSGGYDVCRTMVGKLGPNKGKSFTFKLQKGDARSRTRTHPDSYESSLRDLWIPAGHGLLIRLRSMKCGCTGWRASENLEKNVVEKNTSLVMLHMRSRINWIELLNQA